MTYPFPGYFDVVVIDPNGPFIGRLAADATVEVGDLVFGYQPDDDSSDTGIGQLLRVSDVFTTPEGVRYARVAVAGQPSLPVGPTHVFDLDGRLVV